MSELSSASIGPTALVLGGGGARGAYQAGVLRGIARRHPELRLPILTGISAGAINTVFLAAHEGAFAAAADDLAALWLTLSPEQVYDVDAWSLVRNVMRWAWRLVSGGGPVSEYTRGMVDTDPLEHLLRRVLCGDGPACLAGIARNIARGRLEAAALTATSYSTGQSVTWIQGRTIHLWDRPLRRAEATELGVEHVMASSALPLFFPARQVGNEWYGDGGIRLIAPLSPALHLGAARILVISTHRARPNDADASESHGYPPPAQILSVLSNAVFLDVIDQDVLRLKMINDLLRQIPHHRRGELREVEVLTIRPSQDLGRMARTYEPRLPATLRFLTRGWGTRRTASPDVLSLMMFQADYMRALVELGERDAEIEAERIESFLAGEATPRATARVTR